jgi:predicted metal-binding membrane protein
MAMGVGTLQSFLLTWTAMTAAMMAPSVTPFVLSFARRLERRQSAIVPLAASYLIVWIGLGIGVYYLLPWMMFIPAALAVAVVGLYAFTPVMRFGQSRCIVMCGRSDLIEGSAANREAVRAGLAYGLSCVACSGAVMLALVVLGMSNVLLMVAGSALILLYKIAGPWPRRLDTALSVAFAIAGIWLVAA